MDENASVGAFYGLIIGFFIGLVLGVFGVVPWKVEEVQLEAIKAGAAEWVTSETGEPEFKWKECE